MTGSVHEEIRSIRHPRKVSGACSFPDRVPGPGRWRMIRLFSFGINPREGNCIKPMVDCLSKSGNDMLNTRKGDCRKKEAE